MHIKKVILVVFIALSISGFAHAQMATGKTLLGGTIAYHQTADKYASYIPAKQNSVTINPSVGRVIKENLVLGVEVNFSSNKINYDYPVDKSTSKGKVYGGNVYLRKYVPLLQRFYFFGQGSAGFSKSNASQFYIDQVVSKSSGWGTALSITPGLTYAITKKFYVEAGLNSLVVLGYNHLESEGINTGTGTVSRSNSNTLNFSTSLGSNGGFSVGFRFLL